MEEVIIIGKVVLRRIAREDARSHGKSAPQNLIARHPYRITRYEVPHACCPTSQCKPEAVWERHRWRKALEKRVVSGVMRGK